MTVSGIQGAMARVNQIMSSVPGAAPPAVQAGGAVGGSSGDFAAQLQSAQRSAGAGAPVVPGAVGATAVAGPGSSPTGMRMLQIAQGEVGQGEDPKGSNDGVAVRKYRTATPHTGPGDPWCSTWTTWLYNQATGQALNDGKGYAWVPDMENHGKRIGTWMDKGAGTPAPGDFILFDGNGDGTSDHIGIIERVNADGSVETIEGNSGTNDVARRHRDTWYGTMRMP